MKWAFITLAFFTVGWIAHCLVALREDIRLHTLAEAERKRRRAEIEAARKPPET